MDLCESSGRLLEERRTELLPSCTGPTGAERVAVVGGGSEQRGQRGAIWARFISIHGCFLRLRPWCWCLSPQATSATKVVPLVHLAWTYQLQSAGSPCSSPVMEASVALQGRLWKDRCPLVSQIHELKVGCCLCWELWSHVTVWSHSQIAVESS